MNKYKKIGIILLVILLVLILVHVISIFMFQTSTLPQKDSGSGKIERPMGQASLNSNEKADPSTGEDILPEEQDIPDIEESDKEVFIENGNEMLLPDKKDPGPLYIPYSKSLIWEGEVQASSFAGYTPLLEEERERLSIHRMQVGINFPTVSSDRLLSGKVYYEGDHGRLESFIYLNPDGTIAEYLISHSPEGKYVNSLEIGKISPKGENRKYATLSVSKLSVFEIESSGIAGHQEEKVTEYFITPVLDFVKGKTFTKLK